MDPLYFLAYYSPWILTAISTPFAVTYFLEKRHKKLDIPAPDMVRGLQERNNALAATAALNSIVLETLEFNEVTKRIVNAIPKYLGYQTGVLAMVDHTKNVLHRVAISETQGGIAALASLEVPFTNIDIDLMEEENLCIKALKDNTMYSTTNLYDVLRPSISKENADKVQEKMGTRTTLIYPIYSLDKKPLGTFLLSMDKSEAMLTDFERQTISNFVNGIRIALYNSLLYTSIKNTTDSLKLVNSEVYKKNLDLKQIKDELARANDRLQELDRLKDDFVSLASHELRTPMTAIKSYLWLFLQYNRAQLNPKEQLYIERAYNATDRLIALVNDMLNVSRIESGRINIMAKPTDLTNLAKEVMDELAPTAQKQKINLKLDLPTQPLPRVSADPNKIREVIINLVGNSLKFTDSDGVITIKMYEENDMVVTRVIDTGKGIKAEDMQKLFQKFGIVGNQYLQKQNSQGTGLGLYISKSIVQLHGGTIWAESEGEGKGTTFSFTLKVDHSPIS